MKKTASLSVTLGFLVSACTVMQDVGRSTIGGVISAVPSVTITYPFEPFGTNSEGNIIRITNSTSFYLKFVALCEDVGFLASGGTATAVSRWEPIPQPIPVLALAYTDGLFHHFVGSADRVFFVDNAPSLQTWDIHNGELKSPDATWVRAADEGVYPLRRTQLENKEFDLGRIWWKRTTVVQIHNNTLHDSHVSLNGVERSIVPPLGLYCGDLASVVTGEPAQPPIQILFRFVDGNIYIGSAEFFVGIGDDVQVFQHVILPHDIQRY